MISIGGSVTAPTECRIFLKVTAPGVADRFLFVDVPVLKPSDAKWGNYIRPGESLLSGGIPRGEPGDLVGPASTKNEFESLDTEVCTVDSNGR